MDLIKKFLSWLTYTRAKEPIRKILNETFVHLLAGLLLLAAGFSIYFYLDNNLGNLIISFLAFPMIILSWLLNRHGGIEGILLIVAFITIGTSYNLTIPNDYTVSVLLTVAPIIATRFLTPDAGIWTLFLQLFTAIFFMVLREVPYNVITRYVVFAFLNLSIITLIMGLSASMLQRALRKSIVQELKLINMYDSIILGWSSALELRDKETKGHTDRVTNMTMHMAKLAGVKEEDLLYVKRGALLHDIGKTGIPDEILLKPGPLTKLEWDIMKLHTIYAHQWLKGIDNIGKAIEIPYCHHERWDGTGYPRGLKGEQIPISARIFSIIDAYDALGSKRPYREALPREEVLEQIKLESGRAFDPVLVEIFLREEKKFIESDIWNNYA